MNTEELSVLATDINTNPDPDVQQALAAENYAALAWYYNQPEIYFSWLSSLPVSMYKEVIVWEEMRTGISPESARIWEWMTSNMSQPLNVSDADIRAGIRATWFDTNETLNRLDSISKRNLTTAEMLFKEGSGNGSPVDPYLFGWEGEVTESDVTLALNAQFVSNEVVLTNQRRVNQRLKITVSADLSSQVTIQYQVKNGIANWSKSQGLFHALLAGVYYVKLSGGQILDADASVRVINPLSVAVTLEVERL